MAQFKSQRTETYERLAAAHKKLEMCYPHTMTEQDREDFVTALKALDEIQKRAEADAAARRQAAKVGA